MRIWYEVIIKKYGEGVYVMIVYGGYGFFGDGVVVVLFMSKGMIRKSGFFY